MMKVLSVKQQSIIDFIHRFLGDRSYPPTVRDIVIGCGISSTSVVAYNLAILEKKATSTVTRKFHVVLNYSIEL